MAIYDVASEECRIIELAGSYGSKNPIMYDSRLWIVNYDHFCRVDLETFEVSSSSRLQPEILNKEVGRRGSAFVGVPLLSIALNGWLIPRPYSSDILLIDFDSLEPTGRIRCGGRPHALAEFDDGTLFIINHPFDSFQQASITDLEAL
ncbi:MAG: hypothetical protein RH945_06645 [Hyphomonas sp.]